jgi:hypothetical protein
MEYGKDDGKPANDCAERERFVLHIDVQPGWETAQILLV